MCETNTVDLTVLSKTLMGTQLSSEENSNESKNVAPSLQEKKTGGKKNNETKEWNENQVGGPVLRRSLRIRERLAKLANTLESEKKMKKDENEKVIMEREKRRTNADRLITRRSSAYICQEGDLLLFVVLFFVQFGALSGEEIEQSEI
uniref:Uncharacterized protein n=1 Tax=Angiostrongylus cantonensis TaxID=6313 RepID=A0A0K0DPR2_ANGCA